MVPILLEGRWVYTIQGLMQWTNPDNLTVDPSNKLEWVGHFVMIRTTRICM
jgi:hypothetical protein